MRATAVRFAPRPSRNGHYANWLASDTRWPKGHYPGPFRAPSHPEGEDYLAADFVVAKALDVPVRKILDAEENGSLPEVPRALQRRIDKIKDLSPKAQKTVSDMIDALTKAEGTGK